MLGFVSGMQFCPWKCPKGMRAWLQRCARGIPAWPGCHVPVIGVLAVENPAKQRAESAAITRGRPANQPHQWYFTAIPPHHDLALASVVL